MKRIVLSSLAIFTGLFFTATASHAASLEIGLSFDGASRTNVAPSWGGDPASIFSPTGLERRSRA